MKIVIVILFIVSIIFCEINVFPDTLYKHVKVLTTTPQYRNYENIECLDSAARYIKHKLGDYGFSMMEQVYEVKGNKYRNIIGKIGPESEEVIIIGAHYDVYSDQPGANDNGSGVAGLLELGRILSQNKKNLKTQIHLIGYTLEEPPFFQTNFMGSAVHARQCDIWGQKIKYMISLDMIGYFSDSIDQEYPAEILNLFMPKKANFITVLGKRPAKKMIRGICRSINRNTDLKSRHLIVPAKVFSLDLSDHINYHKTNVKALLISDTSFMRYDHYHKRTDTIDKLNFNKMADVIKGTALYIIDSAK